MRRLTVLAFLAVGLAACGGSGSSPHTSTPGPGTQPGPVVFGRSGGNIRPSRTTVEPNPQLAHQLQLVFGSLKSMNCPGTSPDFATEYIRFQGRTVRVHGTCEPDFSHLFVALGR